VYPEVQDNQTLNSQVINWVYFARQCGPGLNGVKLLHHGLVPFIASTVTLISRENWAMR
jgi:hypothetical protein